MENDDFFFKAYLVHANKKNKRGTRRRKNMNSRTRGSECAFALKRVHDSNCSIYESNLKTKTKNGKEIRGFRLIHQLYLESVQEIFETEKQEWEDECNFFDHDFFDFDNERNDDWRDYATEESRHQMKEIEKHDFNLDCFFDYDFDYEDYPEDYPEEEFFA